MRYLWIIIGMLLATVASAQHTVAGKVVSESKESLIGATVVLLDKDSTLVAFGLADDEGKFSMDGVPTGDYIVQATYVSYSNYEKNATISADTQLPTIVMQETSELIQEVEIRAEHIPMGVYGDTIKYNASAFKTRPNAVVKDLLKQLPGIVVGSDGSIKAHGKDINQILVDGKEFFGGSTKVASENLDAASVSKVEVYDKRSDMASFSGVDDGKKEKVINLTLKESYTADGFGRVEADAGRKTYSGKLNYFRYAPKVQMAALLSSNNINNSTVSLTDKLAMHGNDPTQALASGSFDASTPGVADGLNRAIASGVNVYADISSKTKLSTHYMFNTNSNRLDKTSERTGYGKGFKYTEQEKMASMRRNGEHTLNALLEYRPSKSWMLSWTNNALLGRAQADSKIQNRLKQDSTMKMTSSQNSMNQNKKSIDSKLSIKKRLSDAGRTVMTDMHVQYDDSRAKGRVRNTSDRQELRSNIHQDQTLVSDNLAFGVTTQYTEPLSKRTSLGVKYEYSQQRERPDKKYFDKNGARWVLNEALSSQFVKRYRYQRGGLSLHHAMKHVRMDVGIDGQASSLGGWSDAQVLTQKKYRHLLPSASVSVEFGKASSLDMAYKTQVQVPTLQQLMPIVDNSHPTRQFIGNPRLKPTYEHSLSLSYFSYDSFDFSSFYVHTESTYTRDRVVNSMTMDKSLFQAVKPINVQSHLGSTLALGYTQPVRSLGIVYDFSSVAQASRYDNIINTVADKVSETSFNTRLSIRNKKQTRYTLEGGVSLDLTRAVYDTNKAYNQKFASYHAFTSLGVQLQKWHVSSDVRYTRFSKDADYKQADIAIWNAGIRRMFLKDKLEVRLRAHDLLNQNKGFKRQAVGSSLSQESYTNVGRYIMLGVSYKL